MKMEAQVMERSREDLGHVHVVNNKVVKKKRCSREQKRSRRRRIEEAISRSPTAVTAVETTLQKKRCSREQKRRRRRRIEEAISRSPTAVTAVETTLQKLFVSCKEVFKGVGTVPRPIDVQRLCSILDSMKPEDVGLSSDLLFFKSKSNIVNPEITYTTIYECKNFSLCIFFLPATGVIPLHNHPEMTVFNKLLLGTMHIKSYDWVVPDDSDASSTPKPASSSLRLARLKANSLFTAPCNTSVLYPTSGGNIHQFTAIKPCAFLDVLGPPYSKDDGRDCTYYRDFPYSTPSSNGQDQALEKDANRYGWLEEIEMPENSHMEGIEYLGPQIIDTSLN